MNLTQNEDRKHEALWACFLGQIHMRDFENAKKSIEEINKAILKREEMREDQKRENQGFKSSLSELSELDLMAERASLLHYSLFVYFNLEDSFESMVGDDSSLFWRYLDTINTV